MNRRSFALHQPGLAAASLLGAWWGLAAPAAAQGGFKLQTPTALPPTPQGWTFLALDNGDLAAVNRRGADGKVGIYIVEAASGYQRFALQTETPMAAVDDDFAFVALPNRDIAGIHRNGAGGRTELHVLDAAKGYKAYRLQVPTVLPPSDRRWSFGVDGEGNLVGINRLGVSGKTEIHVVDASRKYGRFRLQAPTALQATDSTWDFGVLASGDLVGIHRQGDSGKTELHVLDAGKDYRRFKLQTPSPLATADEAWKFAVRGNGDVMAVLTRGAASGKTELHVFGSVR
jgi:hypothetical protein